MQLRKNNILAICFDPPWAPNTHHTLRINKLFLLSLFMLVALSLNWHDFVFSNQKSTKPTGVCVCVQWQVKQFPLLQTNTASRQTDVLEWRNRGRTLEGGSTHRLSFCQSKFLGVWLHQRDGRSGTLQKPIRLPGTQACKSLSRSK